MTIAAILCPGEGQTEEKDQKLEQHGFEFNTRCIFQIMKLLNAQLSFPEREV